MKNSDKKTALPELRREIEAVIRIEIEDGHRKQSEVRQWGDTGVDIVTAASAAFDAVDAISEESEADYLGACMLALHRTHLAYRRDHDDDSGHGSECLHTIKAAVVALGKRHGFKIAIPDMPDTLIFDDSATLPSKDDLVTRLQPKARPSSRTKSLFSRLLSILGF
ncbi:hypothetical protein [Salidesulfovibrio brasiliensis]|uniref:hypothetical protein n=1 Tax=Salidesulfovibrio brasiliensis TaxID=221711 RepID=UPI0006CFE193|nr:hypothetical protein [Salidesulfovibrio brasiliensis]